MSSSGTPRPEGSLHCEQPPGSHDPGGVSSVEKRCGTHLADSLLIIWRLPDGSSVAGRAAFREERVMCCGRDWFINRNDFDRLLGLPYSGWSWEFKRRDESFRQAAFRARPQQPIILMRPDGSKLIRLRQRSPEAEAFGLQYFPDPDLSALETSVFWIPEFLSRSLDAVVELDGSARLRSTPLRWDRIPGDKQFLIGPGRRPKLLIVSRAYTAQLAIEERALPVPQALYISIKLGADHLRAERFKPIGDFARFCGGVSVADQPLRGYSPETLRDALIALDGHLAGASQRRIAETIFGTDLVRQDWESGVKAYKSRTRRLIQKGVDLMTASYRNLL